MHDTTRVGNNTWPCFVYLGQVQSYMSDVTKNVSTRVPT